MALLVITGEHTEEGEKKTEVLGVYGDWPDLEELMRFLKERGWKQDRTHKGQLIRSALHEGRLIRSSPEGYIVATIVRNLRPIHQLEDDLKKH